MSVPFRADHIGSLLRPKKLREAFRAHSLAQMPEANSAPCRTSRSATSSACRRTAGCRSSPTANSGASLTGRNSSA